MSERASSDPAPLPRRAEWRWLLPMSPGGAFQHLILLGGHAALAEQLLQCGIAKRVSRGLTDPRAADAVIVLAGAGVHPAVAARCLAPGGALYCEVDRRQAGLRTASPGRLGRTLRGLGLTVTGAYLVRPSFAACREYLPLDRSGAIRWYLRTLHTPEVPGRQVRAAALRTLARVDLRLLSPLLPSYALTATATESPSAGACSAILELPDLPAGLKQPGLGAALFAPGDAALSHLILFPFARNGDAPAAVLKFPRSSVRNSDIENGQAVLAAVRRSLQGPVLGTLPEPLGLLRAGDLSVSVESYLPGIPLAASNALWASPLRRKLANLEDTAAWLAEFHREAQLARPVWGSGELATWVEAPLTSYVQAFSATPREAHLFDAVRERARSLLGTEIPIVWQHRGLHLHNILRDKHQINVLDWEYAEPALPLVDLVYFIWQWRQTARRPRGRAARVRAFEQTFCEPAGAGWSSKAAERVISQYTTRLGLDARLVSICLVLTWVFYALKHYHHTAQDRGPGEDARANNHFASFIGILAEHADFLFPERRGIESSHS